MDAIHLLDNPSLKTYQKRFRKGDAIFHQGEEGDAMFVVLDGSVHLMSEKGVERVVVATLKRGQYFGERAIFSHTPTRRYFSAIAHTHCILLRFTNEDFSTLAEEEPELALTLVKDAFRDAASRLETSNALIRAIRSPDLAERFVRLLLHFSQFQGKKVVEGYELILSPELFLSYIDAEYETIEACMQYLISKQLLLQKVHDHYVVTNEEKLFLSIDRLRDHLSTLGSGSSQGRGWFGRRKVG